MTNPDNIVRVRARNGGRASVYEANGWAQAYTSGLVEGNGVIQNTSADMNVLVGGSASKPDVVLAENPAGYKIALDLVGQQAVAITAPASNSRISAIVAYTDDLSLATTEDTVTGSPASCGLIVVNGTASASPSDPTDNQIRTAITADGATGSQAAYCVIATILVENTTTIITDSLITIKKAAIGGKNIDFTTFGAFSRYIDGSQAYTAWQEVAMQLDNKDFDDYGCTYNSTSHEITITHGGIWVLAANGGCTGTGADNFGTIAIAVNGTDIATTRYRGSGSFPAVGSLTTVVKVSAGDVIKASIAPSAAITNSSRTYQNFSGACIQAIY